MSFSQVIHNVGLTTRLTNITICFLTKITKLFFGILSNISFDFAPESLLVEQIHQPFTILLQCDYCSQGHSNNENQSQCRMGAKYSNRICNLSQLCQVQNNTITSTCSLTRILNSRFPLQYNFNLFACDKFKISFQFLPY